MAGAFPAIFMVLSIADCFYLLNTPDTLLYRDYLQRNCRYFANNIFFTSITSPLTSSL